MRTVLPVAAVLMAAAAILTIVGGGGGMPRGVSDALAAIVISACAAALLVLFVAPGFGDTLNRRLAHLWERLRTRRAEVDEIKDRVEQLQHPHHMMQLGSIYLRQGRFDTAADWFSKALEKDEDHVDARYKLALCQLGSKRYEQAAELLEEVHDRKPEHDYGGAYLHLARVQELCGNDERAREVYGTLLRFYPGHPEGTYRYARLLERNGNGEPVREYMRQIVSAVRNSPAFQRRRNRHWMLRAQWWLWRH